jgi:hypothetical protein
MAQILEVVIAMVVSAMMATAITTLALSPIKTQRQKNVYAASEATAIAVRKCIVDNPATFESDTDITAANVSSTCLSKVLPSGSDVSCEVRTDYTPAGTLINVPYAIQCSQSGVSGNMGGLAWQPLYTVTAMMSQANTLTATDMGVCLSKWLSDASATYTGTTAPTSENLATRYPADCGGLKNPFNFTPDHWHSGSSPCAVTIEIGTSGSPPTKTTVKFIGDDKPCSP